jgi:hypothetical protein
MHCLSAAKQYEQRVRSMNTLYTPGIRKPQEEPITCEASAEPGSGRLEVNVIFTDPLATAAALRSADVMARDLGCCIHLRAVVAVPVQLPLDQPMVPVPFFEQLLRNLARELETDTSEPIVSVYLCRDRVRTLLEILRPNSLVVIGGRKRPWPTRESRTARTLQSAGHRVVFVSIGRKR